MVVFLARLLIPSFSLIFFRFPTEDSLCRSGFQLASRCSICGNCRDGFSILCRFGFRGQASKAPVIKSVFWSSPAPGWIKVNTDCATMGSPGVGGCSGIFRNCKAFVKGCFAIPLCQVFVFEVELLADSLAINFAWKYGWP
ncbi:hypothetical protein Dsin_032724 [Dipteronia sinensis]|uniref:Uncharacterized protein n=1 Tax=Dipteronia sinensis TaxID=43782 RepID=A0AAD9Z8U0_9ROSI|nr:hypothetical protein Dsin_032724 [Dipteronia sinensis]